MAVNLEERLRSGESVEQLIKRFFKKCKKQDIVREYLDKTSFRSKRERDRVKQQKNQYLRNIEKKKQKYK